MMKLKKHECGFKSGIITCLDGKDRYIIMRVNGEILYKNVKNGKEWGAMYDIRENKLPKWINKEMLIELKGEGC